MIGIIGAVDEEAAEIKKEIKDIKEEVISGISFFVENLIKKKSFLFSQELEKLMRRLLRRC